MIIEIAKISLLVLMSWLYIKGLNWQRRMELEDPDW